MSMWRAALLLAGLTFAGCSTDVTKDMEQLRDRMCACTDATCARVVLGDLVTLARSTRNARGDEDKTQAAARELAKCAIKHGVSQSELVETMKKVGED
ncbi:MAG: hypothetical protein KF773_16515 [Deltaproteobacteria bacterium]|nr:hypothetical protein [Deltaproteobacteria bacterium]MCW5807190.1 hypothetical protein [Deltaproteobacteria bacterium]